MILVEMWIAKGWKRPLRMEQLASLAKFSCGSLPIYLAFRLCDLAIRGELGYTIKRGRPRAALRRKLGA
jgi:formate dehydrogenase iron-sulfur subunit